MDGVRIRDELRPGDLGEVTRLHGLLYAAEYDLDSTFEAYVARAVAECVEAGWPGRGGEGLWVAENGGGHVLGHVALTREGPGEARLRWFLLTRTRAATASAAACWTSFCRWPTPPGTSASR